MKTVLSWKDGMAFNARVGDHTIALDAKAPIGKETGATPKELVAMGIGGCTAMDVVALLKKYKQTFTSFRVDVEVQPTTGVQPVVFENALVTFYVQGNVDPEKLKEAVVLSQTKFCGVSAMLSKAFPIHYKIILNDQEIGTGSANFE